MYDIIGDIHGYAGELKQLLNQLGYQERNGCWQHPERCAVFLGDFVDRGPEQVETVNIVQAMVEGGSALAVMGNHEFNAVAYATPNPHCPGEYLRCHTPGKQAQHRTFLHQVGEGSELHRHFLDWFKTLPLYLELPEFRVIHACWHPWCLQRVAPLIDENNRFKEEAWTELGRQDSDALASVETLLKGVEIPLPRGFQFQDKDNRTRSNIRTEWWNVNANTYRDLALVPERDIENIPRLPLPDAILPGYDREKALFVGHYWLKGEPAPLTDHIACLDYSVADRCAGKLCAYRWSGEELHRNALCPDNFSWVGTVH